MLGIAIVAALLVVVVDAAIRLIRARRPGRLASWGLMAVLILAGMAAAGGPNAAQQSQDDGLRVLMIPKVSALTPQKDFGGLPPVASVLV